MQSIGGRPGRLGRPRASKAWPPLTLALAALVASACAPSVRLPLRPYYLPAQADAVTVQLDIPYVEALDAGASAHTKHRLDLYLPEGSGWPMLIFVHGGSLEKGDTSKRVAGHDVYRNIGRFYADRGVGVALVNYRLQPEVRWLEQVDDVARATTWVRDHLAELGGDGRLFLSGHSAGSWLSAHVALDHDVHARHGLSPDDLAGVILVSGSGFDLTDERTWEMFGREERWRRRFSAAAHDPAWKQRASVVPLIEKGAPRFLLLHSAREYPALGRQNRLFCEALENEGVPCDLEAVPGLGHRRMLLAVSHARRAVAQAILDEVRGAELVRGDR